MEIIVVILSLFYILYLFFEKINLDKNRKNLKYIIHINGIRGKSTVSRLIDAGLRAGGYKVFTKTTGTSPRIIDTNAKEFEINRQGKANIREQISVITWASKEKAEVLILECMAVKPELQYVCENKILKSDIVAITNVREDHLDEMGDSLDKIADSLSNTIPKKATFFTADKNYFNFFKNRCEDKNTRAFLSKNIKNEYWEIDFPNNIALAMDICKYLNVDEKIALEGMRTYHKDPGSLKVLTYLNKKNFRIFFVNTLAANDPDSTEIILDRVCIKTYWNNERYLLVNNRADRLSRLKQFVNFTIKFENRFDKILISGENKNLFYKYLLKNRIDKNRIIILSDEKYFENIEDDSLIFAVGNICRLGKKLVDYFEERGEIIDDK
ncbi:poly-gamma-glutamate synthase PgsB [Fusobacterium nucleatum subsp. nucleatum ATCC 23726]|uniref:Gamma-polyglutamic acid synthetase n=2 Tax=Fusobacterium nucleatum subsp. nucleatum TaxID=76856 RepID=Q8R662_FUSNN|nr:poly-gamma-glutamate synthase PgsB [Fusobacterium nucleatum]AAL95133.1 Gamma-polyglutamic acid synthetase [Fusobacterium nucleatum subsp. nucleatum ATCC 25586]ALF24337.1 poly-gamma-glutamate synthase PgsB [Fusobacterium nucleatum subsp. nucleatum ChDC F316]ALF25399.1 poly-gamma-glutamate synthase PgsB [Fusobacterium nucleatum subsp. nucleatum]ASG26391.1 poly-gamma-glutamate synthase PgsB [Fusobacterium nucleatum subsp. nucleatum]AVQ15301.1 poly-gamma-glutamate synthase PgsB [Fusobacterium n